MSWKRRRSGHDQGTNDAWSARQFTFGLHLGFSDGAVEVEERVGHLNDVSGLPAAVVRLDGEGLLRPAQILGSDRNVPVHGDGIVVRQDPSTGLAERDVPGLGQDHLHGLDPTLKPGQVIELAGSQVDDALKK